MGAFAANLVLLILETGNFISAIRDGGLSILQFYTEDSNLLTLLVSLLYVIIYLREKKKTSTDQRKQAEDTATGPVRMPAWMHLLRFMSTCCLTLTFLIVVTVLAPMFGKGGLVTLLFTGHHFLFHFVCPILSFFSFMMLERGEALPRRAIAAAVAPTAVYAVTTVILNACCVISGPYPFLMVYEQPFYMSVMWFAVILGADAAISWGVRKIKGKMRR